MSTENESEGDLLETCSPSSEPDQDLVDNEFTKDILHSSPIIIRDSEVEEIMYGAESNSIAVSNLVLYSFLIFTLPLLVMYGCYLFLLDYFHLPRDRAALYSGILGAVMVIIIVILFIWRAYVDETRLTRLVDEAKRRRKRD
uniref:Vacuolar ATPase assembly integral membrane protein VMA21 homolog n=1 Tax=Ditylenchus dipsaci TaxID=166011 RepID=A0A915D375_9BILA